MSIKSKILEVTKFQTSNGKEFATLQEAEQHQAVLDLAAWIDGQPDLIFYSDSGSSPTEIADTILRYFTLTPKL